MAGISGFCSTGMPPIWRGRPTGAGSCLRVTPIPTTSALPFDIWVVNADGSDARNLTQGRLKRHDGPTWSPDGKRLAFAASPDGSERELQIFVLDVATGETTQLTRKGNNFAPYWAAKPSCLSGSCAP